MGYISIPLPSGSITPLEVAQSIAEAYGGGLTVTEPAAGGALLSWEDDTSCGIRITTDNNSRLLSYFGSVNSSGTWVHQESTSCDYFLQTSTTYYRLAELYKSDDFLAVKFTAGRTNSSDTYSSKAVLAKVTDTCSGEKQTVYGRDLVITASNVIFYWNAEAQRGSNVGPVSVPNFYNVRDGAFAVNPYPYRATDGTFAGYIGGINTKIMLLTKGNAAYTAPTGEFTVGGTRFRGIFGTALCERLD